MHRTSVERTFSVQRASDRACFDHGWLKTCHSFSFAGYYDPKNTNWGGDKKAGVGASSSEGGELLITGAGQMAHAERGDASRAMRLR